MRWWRRKDREEDLERELRSDLELEAEEQKQRGLSDEAAQGAARKALGNVTLLKEASRELSPRIAVERLWQDLAYAARMLRKSPGFTLAAVLSLALGIGANTAIFSLIDSVLLRMLPVSHPEQLKAVWTRGTQIGQVEVSWAITNAVFREMQARATTVAGLCASRTEPRLNATWRGHAGLSSGEFVSGNYFQVLGVPALLGRTFGPADDRPDGRLAVLSFGYWQRRFGGDPSVIGQSLSINNVPFTIVAVTPREFYGTSLDSEAEIMMPEATRPQVKAGQIRDRSQASRVRRQCACAHPTWHAGEPGDRRAYRDLPANRAGAGAGPAGARHHS